MKIKNVRTVALPPAPAPTTKPRRASWWETWRVASPMTRFPRYAPFRPDWFPPWGRFGVIVEADDGSVGFAVGAQGKPVATIIEEYLGPRIVGEGCMMTEKTYDMMVRMCAPFGATGLASFAISAIDLALWDLKGKVYGKPVYELLGGQTYEAIPSYMTGNDPDWAMELGFKGAKLACPYGPHDGLDGLRKNVELVQQTRELIGPERELMLDCWMALDVEYAVRLAEELRPFKLAWIEECLPAEDMGGHITLRERLNWQTLATGEHWHTPYPFQFAVERHLVDIVQPDIAWVGGMTAMLRIFAVAEASSLRMSEPTIPTGSMLATGCRGSGGPNGRPLWLPACPLPRGTCIQAWRRLSMEC